MNMIPSLAKTSLRRLRHNQEIFKSAMAMNHEHGHIALNDNNNNYNCNYNNHHLFLARAFMVSTPSLYANTGGVEYSTNNNDMSMLKATTVLCVRKQGQVVIMADGQMTLGSEVVKNNVKKVRRIGDDVIGGFAGATTDAFTLFERLEQRLEEHPGQLTRAAVELAKAWRTDRYLRRLNVCITQRETTNIIDQTVRCRIMAHVISSHGI